MNDNADRKHTSSAGKSLWRRALGRSWVCPGAGFALIGRPGLATATYVAVAGLLPAMVWLALDPGPVAAWTFAGVFAVALVLSLIEQVAMKWTTPRPAGPRWLVGGFPVASVIVWAAVIGTLATSFAAFGGTQSAGDGL